MSAPTVNPANPPADMGDCLYCQVKLYADHFGRMIGTLGDGGARGSGGDRRALTGDEFELLLQGGGDARFEPVRVHRVAEDRGG